PITDNRSLSPLQLLPAIHLLLSFLRLSALHQRLPQNIVRVGILRIQLQRVPQHSLSIRQFFLLEIDFPEQDKRTAGVRIQPNGALERRLRFRISILAAVRVAQAVMSHRETWVDLNFFLELHDRALNLRLIDGHFTKYEMCAGDFW